MDRNDDFLDVSAYLQSKIKKNFEDTKDLIEDYSDIDEKYSAMESEIEELISNVDKVATSLGIDTSDLSADIPVSNPEKKHRRSDFVIRLSEDYDYSAAFQDLVNKAHEEGFVDIKPWHLFSEEELQQIESYEEALDIEFLQETDLTEKDIQVLMISVAIRVLYFYLLKFFSSEIGNTNNQNLTQTVTSEPVIDAMQNVDINNINSKEYAKQLLALLGNGFINFKSIKNEDRILNDNLPFDLQDNEFFLRKDILAYHPMLGWLIGIINILTDTVTTNKFESFSVVKSLYEDKEHLEKVQTLGVIFPVLLDWSKNKDSLFAAVVRQADALKVTSAPIEDVSAMLKETIAVEEHNFDIMDKVDAFSRIIPFDLSSLSLGGIFRDAAITAFFNKLITAMHAVRYNPETDGDLKMYTVRTNKIIAISSAIAASVNSLSALITEDVKQADISGIIMSLIAMFNSTKFWINAKADYLVSEYKVKIDEAFSQIDKYFEIVPDDEVE